MAAALPPLKLYFDLVSQPARALFMFLKLNGIPFEQHRISIKDGEHLTDAYRAVNRFAKIPCIVDSNGFKLAETPAILQYLVATSSTSSNGRRPIADHWYPADVQQRARVDEYLSWQHMNTRLHCSTFFWLHWLLPQLQGKKASEGRLRETRAQMEVTLDVIETVWLGQGQKYLAGGEKISVADLLAVCELEQTKLADYDAAVGRPNIQRWLATVKADTAPAFEEAHAILYKIIAVGKARDQKAKL